MQCLRRPEEGGGAPVTRVADAGELRRCWELNLCSLQEQPVLLIAEPCVQAPRQR